MIQASDSKSPLKPALRVTRSCEWRTARRTRTRRRSPTFGMTATALQVALQSPHKTMPNVILEPDELRNLIAYILTLKTRG